MGDIRASLEPATIGQLTSGSNPYQSRRRMAWPSPYGQRRMLYSPRRHHRTPQATLGSTHASQGGLRKQLLKRYIIVSQFIPHLKRWVSLRLEIVRIFRGIFYDKSAEEVDMRHTKYNRLELVAKGLELCLNWVMRKNSFWWKSILTILMNFY